MQLHAMDFPDSYVITFPPGDVDTWYEWMEGLVNNQLAPFEVPPAERQSPGSLRLDVLGKNYFPQLPPSHTRLPVLICEAEP